MRFLCFLAILSLLASFCFALPNPKMYFVSDGFGSKRFERVTLYKQPQPVRNHETECSSERIEEDVKCVCYVTFRLKDDFESEEILKECRDNEGEDLGKLGSFCARHADEDSNLNVDSFLSHIRRVWETCFPQQGSRFLVSNGVIRAAPSDPPANPNGGSEFQGFVLGTFANGAGTISVGAPDRGFGVVISIGFKF